MAEGGREPVGDESLENWKELGSGGFGCVYKANHKDWQFEVAIKLLAGQAALEREADYMDSVAHQFVPRVYGMYRGIPPVPELGSIKRQGIVMELMLGGSLQNLQQALSGPPPWPLAFRLAHQLALAMNFLHSKKSPVVHSDLKPGNVLLDASLGAKIADFGLSTVSTSVLNVTNKGDEGGTLAYTPPEAFEQGQDYRLVRSYDIYSYGILLWTILTGKEPYLAGVKRDVLTFRIIKGDRPDLDKIDQSKAEGLEELVDLMKKCWDKDPTKRPTFRECTEVTGRVFSKHEKGIHAAVTETLTKLQDSRLLQNRQECVPPPDFHCLTLDTNTAHRFLSLSENNMEVTWGGGPDPPDHHDRFDGPIQVLCTEALTGCHYWEVERSGAVSVAVTYRGISRKGQGKDCRLGCNDNSWSLNCSDGNVYSVIHNSKRTHVPVSSSRYSKRVAVYLDCSAGTLSFYEVSSDTLTPLFHFQNTFTEPLYAGFRLPYSSSSVCLCKDSYSTANPFKDGRSETKRNSY